MLIAAHNPCPCGYLGDKLHECKCTPSQILRYQKKLSGPILDRIDIHLEVPAVKTETLTNTTTVAEDSKTIQNRVQLAREAQKNRFKKTKTTSNAEMTVKQIKELCALSETCLNLLKRATASMHLSARSYYRTLKLARTIADLAASESILPEHIAESLQYRPRTDVF
jgi:magnesium chelatase family protein